MSNDNPNASFVIEAFDIDSTFVHLSFAISSDQTVATGEKASLTPRP